MQLSGFPPKAFLIGAQKSGTTQLASLLGQHEQVCLAAPKEPDIFSRNWSHGLEAGRTAFTDPARLCLDASTSYSSACLPAYFPGDVGVFSHYNGVAERIHSVSPQARFIYLLRDPVARAVSGYWHQVRAGFEQRPLQQALVEDSYYLRTSHYAGQIEQYLLYFGLDHFLLLTFEELVRDPQAAAKKCFAFLGLPDVHVSPEGAQNKSFVYGGLYARLNRGLAGVGGLNAVVKKVKPMLPRRVLEWGAERLTQPVPQPTDQDYALLADRFAPMIERLESMTGRRFDEWRTRRAGMTADS